VRAAPLTIAIGLALVAPACAPAPPADFSPTGARAHLDQLAGVIGPRPAGTDSNAAARAYIIQTLEGAGFDVRVQDTEARRPEVGLAGRVRNVIGLLPGQRPEAIGIVAHYDSVPESPGGGDNALGVASALEAARVLASRGTRRWSVYILLTDSEESGLLGAAALLDAPGIAARLKTVVNLDSMGADAPVVLFETGPGNGWLTGVWARAAPSPRGASYFYEIYRRMPNDTDFSVFRRAGIPGLNFAAIGDSYAYHSRLDRANRVTDAAILSAGATVVALVDALEHEDITHRTPDEASYTDLGGLAALSWGPRVDLVLAVLAIALGAAALVRSAAELWRRRGASAPVVTLLWTIISGGLVLAAMTGAVTTLRAVREVYHPWYAHPERLVVLLVAIAAVSVAVLARLSAMLPQAWRPARTPATVWLPALTVWVALTAAAGWGSPRVTFLCALPLLAAAGPLAVSGLRPAPARIAALASGGITFVLFARDGVLLFSFLTSLLGLAGVLVPVWVYPALTAGFAIFLAPPWIALAIDLPSRFTRALLWPLAVLAVASFAWAFMAPAYTPSRPLRASMVQVVIPDGAGHVALASAEPLFAIGAGTPSLVPGRSDVPELRHAVRGAFSVSGRMPAPGPAGSVSVRTLGSDAGAIELDILAAAPGTSVAVLLPHGVEPRDSSLPGVTVAGRWRTRYVGIPEEGLTLRLTLNPADLDRLDEARVWLQPPVGTVPPPGDAAAWWHLPGVAWDVLVRHELTLR